MSKKQELKNQELGEVSGGFTIESQNGIAFIAPGFEGEECSYTCLHRDPRYKVECTAVSNDGNLMWKLQYADANNDYHEEFLDNIKLEPQEVFHGGDGRTVRCSTTGQVTVT